MSFSKYQKALRNTTVDLVLGGQWGDEGKGKKTNDASQKHSYSLCGRFNGGPNAGHTIYLVLNEQRIKVVTHHIPTGFASVTDTKDGIESLIGGGCVVALDGDRSLGKELKNILGKIKRGNEYATRFLKVAYNAHVITEKHIETDSKDTDIGTTRSGIGPTYAAKANRTTATRVEDVMVSEIPSQIPTEALTKSPGHKGWLILKDCENVPLEVVDPVDFWVGRASELPDGKKYEVLLEAGQGFKLDIDWAYKYPYNTSSGCGTPSAANFGIPMCCFRDVTTVYKIYETYVGAWTDYQPDDPEMKNLLMILAILGHEFGATTGRPRMTNWFRLRDYVRCVTIWGSNSILVNKCDILEEYLSLTSDELEERYSALTPAQRRELEKICPNLDLSVPRKLYYYDMEDQLQEVATVDELIDIIKEHTLDLVNVYKFSYSPDHI